MIQLPILASILATMPNVSANHIKTHQLITEKPRVTRSYQEKDFSYLLNQVKGFDRNLLQMHFKLYEGYVKNTNALLASLTSLAEQGKTLSYEYGALKRRVGWEFDGMRLHEYYFSNMGSKTRNEESSLSKLIKEQYKSFDAWKSDFMSTGKIRGIGWAILYFDDKEGRLINTWINEHDLGHLSGCMPLLVMDVWEHAYITQFGLDREKYIQTFFDNINWDEVEKRFEMITRSDSSQKLLKDTKK